MAYTFLEAQNKLSSLLGDPNTGSDNQFPLADRKVELNNAEIDFAERSKNLLEYATSTVSGMEIDYPSDMIEIVALYVSDVLITNDREVSIADLGRLSSFSGSIPYYYTWQESGTWKIKLLGNSSSINGDTYKLYYVKRPTTDLVDDTDTSEHQEQYRPAIPFKAAAELFLQIGQYSRASQLSGAYDMYVKRATREAEKRAITYFLPDIDINYFPASETDRVGG